MNKWRIRWSHDGGVKRQDADKHWGAMEADPKYPSGNVYWLRAWFKTWEEARQFVAKQIEPVWYSPRFIAAILRILRTPRPTDRNRYGGPSCV